MYINNKTAAEYAANVNERVLNYNVNKEASRESLGRAYCSHIGKKTWPEVIRLYKEFKSKKTILS